MAVYTRGASCECVCRERECGELGVPNRNRYLQSQGREGDEQTLRACVCVCVCVCVRVCVCVSNSYSTST